MNKAIDELIKFRDEREWKQFHNAKDLSLALSIESSELLELFLWKSPEDANKVKIKDELADIMSYCLLLCEKYDLNPEKIILDKIKINSQKYPVIKAKGVATIKERRSIGISLKIYGTRCKKKVLQSIA